MSLSCSCDVDWDGDGWAYYDPSDYSVLNSKRRKRCCSCKAMIAVGATVTEFERHRRPNTEMEDKILGEDAEVPLASWYMCEECSDLFFSIKDLGFCIALGDESMQAHLKEYHQMRENGDF